MSRFRLTGSRAVPFPAGPRIFLRIHARLGCAGRPPRFVVEFYPYASLTSTIRLRDEVALARLSDVLHGAPLAVLEATAAVLLSRLYRRPLPRALRRVYDDFSVNAHTQRRLRGLRRARAARAPAATSRDHHDLAQLFTRLNRRYFAGGLRRPHLAWSARPWRAQLGCFDAALGQIVLNRRLDSPRVPRFAVEYVLYHEMLHVKHPVRRATCGLQAHSGTFRREERLFRDFARARRFLERLP